MVFPHIPPDTYMPSLTKEWVISIAMYQNKPYKLALAYTSNLVVFYTAAKHCIL